MNKRTVRLTESDLHRVIKESVRQVLNELSFQTAQGAYQASQDPNRPLSPAMQRRSANSTNAFGKRANALKQGASNAFNRDYGYNLKNVPYGSGDDYDMTVADTNKPFYGGRNYYKPFGDSFDSVAGRYNKATGEANAQTNMRATQHWDDPSRDPNEYDQRGINLSFKDQISNPAWANAVRKGEKALDKTIQRRSTK